MTGLPSGVVVRPRRDDETVELGRLLLEQQPTSRYPYRDPLPWPAEEFVRRPGEVGAWVAQDERTGELLGHVALGACHDPAVDGEVERAWERAHGRPWTELVVLQAFFTSLPGRGRGLGRPLHDAAVARARELDRSPCLDVLPTHERAYATYPRWGWVEVGSFRPGWLAEDAPDLVAMVLPAG